MAPPGAEAFLDVAGAFRLFGSPTAIAVAIRQRVRADIGLPLSIGLARTKHLAKVASQVAKSDGLVVVPAEGEPEFLEHLPVGLIWGVGPVTVASCPLKAAGGGCRYGGRPLLAGTTRTGAAQRHRARSRRHGLLCVLR
jgi:hypothetical protein